MQLLMSAVVVAAGLWLALTGDGGIRAFGWLLAVLGVLGVVARFVYGARGERNPGDRPPRSR
jgi:hypothetical protein